MLLNLANIKKNVRTLSNIQYMHRKPNSKREPRGFLNPFELVSDTFDDYKVDKSKDLDKNQIFTQPESTLPPEMDTLPGLIKNCLKKDSTTKIKALQGLLSCLSQYNNIEKLSTSNIDINKETALDIGWNYILCYFTKIFSVCTQDESYLVREQAIHLLVYLIRWNKKILGKLIKDIIVSWLTCYVDLDPSVRQSARDIFHQVFNTFEKMTKVIHISQDNIHQYIIEGIQYNLFHSFEPSSYQQERQISSAHNILALCISITPDMAEFVISHDNDLTIHHPDICFSKCISGYPSESIKRSIYTVFRQLINYSKDSCINFCKNHLLTSDSGLKELTKTKEALELVNGLIYHLYSDVCNTEIAEILERWTGACYSYLNRNPYYALHMLLNIMNILETNRKDTMFQRNPSQYSTIDITLLFTQNTRINICHCMIYLMEYGTSLPIHGILSRSQEELAASLVKLLPIIHKDTPMILERLFNSFSLDTNASLITGQFWNVFKSLSTSNQSILSDILIVLLDTLKSKDQNKPFYDAFVSLIHKLPFNDIKSRYKIKDLFNTWINNPNSSPNTLKWINEMIASEYHLYDSIQDLDNDVNILITSFLKTVDRNQITDQWSKFSNILQSLAAFNTAESTYERLLDLVLMVVKCPELQYMDLLQFVLYIPNDAFSGLLTCGRDLIRSILKSSSLLEFTEFHKRHMIMIESVLSRDDIMIIVEDWYSWIVQHPDSVYSILNSLFSIINDYEHTSMIEYLLFNISPTEVESSYSPNGLAKIILKLLAELYMLSYLKGHETMEVSFLNSKRLGEALFWAVLQRNIAEVMDCDSIQDYASISSKIIVDTEGSIDKNIDIPSFLHTFDSIIQSWIIASIPIAHSELMHCYPDDYPDIIWPFLLCSSNDRISESSKVTRTCLFMCLLGICLMRDHELDNCSTEFLVFIQSRLIYYIENTREGSQYAKALSGLVMGHVLSHVDTINDKECFNIIWKWDCELGHPIVIDTNDDSLGIYSTLNKLLSSRVDIWVIHILLMNVQSIYTVNHDISDIIMLAETEKSREHADILWWILFFDISSKQKIQFSRDFSQSLDCCVTTSNIIPAMILLSESNTNMITSSTISKILDVQNLDAISLILAFSILIPSIKNIAIQLLEFMQQHEDSWKWLHKRTLTLFHGQYKDCIPTHIEKILLSFGVHEYYCNPKFWIDVLPLFEKHYYISSKDGNEISKIFKDRFYNSYDCIPPSHCTSIIIAMLQHHDSMNALLLNSLIVMDDYSILYHGLFDHIDILFLKDDEQYHGHWDKDIESYFSCWDIKDEKLTILGSITPLEWLSLFRKCLLYFPSSMRCWWRDCPASFQRCPSGTFIRTVLQKYLYQDVVRYQIERLMASKDRSVGPTSMKINACYSSHHELSVRASIPIEYQQQVEIIVRFPILYPLLPVIVQGGQRIGVSESIWRKWLFSSQALLSSQHGSSLLDGLTLWEQNTRKRFEGTSECAICYCILQVTDLSLPTHPCKTCKNKFHSICLYKWFKSSGNSTCPLCRSIFSS